MDGSVNDRGLGLSVNWREIGMDFRRAGFGTSKVARALNLPQQTVDTWFNRNREPFYTDGLMLLRLHAIVVGETGNKERMSS